MEGFVRGSDPRHYDPILAVLAIEAIRFMVYRQDNRATMKATELREMSDEQLELTAVEAAETLFRLRLQSQTDRVDIPTQNKKNRRLIARVKTIQTQRTKVAGT